MESKLTFNRKLTRSVYNSSFRCLRALGVFLIMLMSYSQVSACDCDGAVNNVSYTLTGNMMTVSANKSYTSSCGGSTFGYALAVYITPAGSPHANTPDFIGNYIIGAGAVPLLPITFPIDVCQDYDIHVSQASGSNPASLNPCYWQSVLVESDVNIDDTTAPTPVCDQNASTTLSGVTGTVTINAEDMDAGSSDNNTADEDLIFSYSGTDINDIWRTYDCDDLGPNDVSIWVWDECGNVSEECFAVIVVYDNTAPDCQAIPALDVVLGDMGTATISVDDIENGTTDLCGVEFLSIDITDFDCDDVALSPIKP